METSSEKNFAVESTIALEEDTSILFAEHLANAINTFDYSQHLSQKNFNSFCAVVQENGGYIITAEMAMKLVPISNDDITTIYAYQYGLITILVWYNHLDYSFHVKCVIW